MAQVKRTGAANVRKKVVEELDEEYKLRSEGETHGSEQGRRKKACKNTNLRRRLNADFFTIVSQLAFIIVSPREEKAFC